MQLDELRHDTAQGHTAVAKCSEQIILTLHVEFFSDLAKSTSRNQFLGGVTQALCLITDEIHAAFDILLAVLLLKPRAYLAARGGGSDRVQPIRTWAVARLVRDDGYDVAILELVFERYNLSVDLCTNTVMSNLRVDVIGEVNGIRPLRQINDITARCKDKDLVGEYVQFQSLEELLGIVIFLLQTDHLAQP